MNEKNIIHFKSEQFGTGQKNSDVEWRDSCRKTLFLTNLNMDPRTERPLHRNQLTHTYTCTELPFHNVLMHTYANRSLCSYLWMYILLHANVHMCSAVALTVIVLQYIII